MSYGPWWEEACGVPVVALGAACAATAVKLRAAKAARIMVFIINSITGRTTAQDSASGSARFIQTDR